MLAGVIGSIVPLLPGPPLSYVGMLMLQFREEPVFSLQFMLIWLAVVFIVALLDYVVPLYGTKKFGGTKYGVRGCAVGLLVGLWFGPVGIILGPFIGAFIGEVLANSESKTAWWAAVGSFIGFAFSTLLKLVTCLVMGWYFVTALTG